MVSNDLLEGERMRIGCHVAIRCEDDVVTETHGTANGRIDAELGHAPANDQLPDRSRR